ncbi:MAG: hypothetical protein IJX78_06745 [Bacilli bacterium]|nr:hypothetical protein [Bacilli bacterium]
MKVLVNEIEKDVLVDIMQHFVTDSEIVILEDAAIEYKTLDCNQPYYIEENIINLDKVLELCTDVSYNRTPIRNIVSWDKFCLFWALMFSIYKQRELGRKISDLEYLYEKYKNKYELTLSKTSQLNLGFTIDEDVLVGESKLGKMYLYKQDEYFDFVFSVEYKSEDLFGKEKIKHTHWHPQDFFEASDDLDKFMSNINIFELK